MVDQSNRISQAEQRLLEAGLRQAKRHTTDLPYQKKEAPRKAQIAISQTCQRCSE